MRCFNLTEARKFRCRRYRQSYFTALRPPRNRSVPVINPDNRMMEMERVIAEARRNSQPTYIVVPSDYALAPVTITEVRPATLRSNEASLENAVAAIAERVRHAKSVVALPAFTVSRFGLQKEARHAIEALGCPFASTTMEKCIIDESYPQFAGMYAGALSAEKTRKIVEDAELVLDFGGISLNDILVNHRNLQLRKLRLDKPDQLIAMGVPIRHGDNDPSFSDINW